MTTTQRPKSHHRLDVASLALLLAGLVFGVVSYWFITTDDFNALVIIPSVVAITIGASHLIKREAPHR